MDPLLRPWWALFALNTRLLVHAVEGIDDEAAWRRPDARVNSIGFLVLHALDARYVVAELLASPQPRPFGAMLDAVNGIEELREHPPLADIMAEWARLGRALDHAFDHVRADQIESTASLPYTFPIADRTAIGSLAFLGQHESYHLGQVAMLRKWLGLGAMRYT